MKPTTHDFQRLLKEGRQKFIDGKYNEAEQFLLRSMKINNREPEVFQMLATIFYERGKFKLAIQTFKRALAIDPDYTDASVGLSIVLNDIGRYDDAKKVFESARKRLDSRNAPSKSQLHQELVKKHLELGQIYQANDMWGDAIQQYRCAGKWSHDHKIVLHLALCYSKIDKKARAIHELQMALRRSPDWTQGRLELGKVLFDENRVAEAITQWENILMRDPQNEEAQKCIQRSQAMSVQ